MRPLQPIVRDEDGILRFEKNAIVKFLLDDGPNDMNRLARIPFSREDREQFAQLIGYSVFGLGQLPYVSAEMLTAVDEAVSQIKPAAPGSERT